MIGNFKIVHYFPEQLSFLDNELLQNDDKKETLG